METVNRNRLASTIKEPPTSASIDGMFGYSTPFFDVIFHILPPAKPYNAD